MRASLVFLLAFLFLPQVSIAQDSRIFVRFDAAGDELEALEDARGRFDAAILKYGGIEQAGTVEMESVFAECRESVGVSGAEERECRLRAARQVFVEHVVEVKVTKLKKSWELLLVVWAPDSNGKVFTDYVEVSERKLADAAREGLPQLAESYLCFRGVSAACDGEARANEEVAGEAVEPKNTLADEQGFLFVTSEPSGATLSINGLKVGVTPYQDEVNVGKYELELSYGESHFPRKEEVTLGSEGATLSLKLEAKEGALSVLSEGVDGTPCIGEVSLDGQSMGTTPIKTSLSVGTHRVDVICGDAQGSADVEIFHNIKTMVTVEVRSPTPPGYVLIKAGTFEMGSPESEEGRSTDEVRHQVTLTRDFFMKRTEVTQGEWEALMGSNPSYFSGCGSSCPVEQVSWEETLSYLNSLSRSEGLEECYDLSNPGPSLDCEGYRLPTEAEWEYAARAGTSSALYSGDLTLKGKNNGPELDPIAWYGGNSIVSYSGAIECSHWEETQLSLSTCGTHPVGSKTANSFGLYDMVGNVWEWTWDWRSEYPGGAQTDPTGPATGEKRVSRGGSWDTYAASCRSARRVSDTPDYTNYIMGFRAVRTVH